MRKLIIWYKAYFLNYPLFKVIYKDGRRTHLLYYQEAKELSEVFNGKLIIDYEAAEIYQQANKRLHRAGQTKKIKWLRR